MLDFLAMLQYVLVGDWFPALLLGGVLMSMIVMLLVLLLRVLISILAWPNYEAWTQRKRWHIAQYIDRTMPSPGESLSQWLKFRAAWRRQPLFVKIWWMITYTA